MEPGTFQLLWLHKLLQACLIDLHALQMMVTHQLLDTAQKLSLLERNKATLLTTIVRVFSHLNHLLPKKSSTVHHALLMTVTHQLPDTAQRQLPPEKRPAVTPLNIKPMANSIRILSLLRAISKEKKNVLGMTLPRNLVKSLSNESYFTKILIFKKKLDFKEN